MRGIGLVLIAVSIAGCAGVNRSSLRLVDLDQASFNPVTRTISGNGMVLSVLTYCEKGRDCVMPSVTVKHDNDTEVTVNGPGKLP